MKNQVRIKCWSKRDWTKYGGFYLSMTWAQIYIILDFYPIFRNVSIKYPSEISPSDKLLSHWRIAANTREITGVKLGRVYRWQMSRPSVEFIKNISRYLLCCRRVISQDVSLTLSNKFKHNKKVKKKIHRWHWIDLVLYLSVESNILLEKPNNYDLLTIFRFLEVICNRAYGKFQCISIIMCIPSMIYQYPNIER